MRQEKKKSKRINKNEQNRPNEGENIVVESKAQQQSINGSIKKK